MIIQGKNLLVYVQGDGEIGNTDELYPIGCDKTCTLSIDAELKETTIKDNGSWKTYVSGLRGVQIAGDGLIDYTRVMSAHSLQNKIINGQIVVFKLVAELTESERVIYSGQGYLNNVTIGGPAEGSATYSYNIIGTGAPDIDNNIPVEGGGGTPTDDMAQVYPLYFRTTTDQTSYQNDVLIGAKLLMLSIEQVILFKDDELGPIGETHWTEFNSATGTVTWNFNTFNKSRGYIQYKK